MWEECGVFRGCLTSLDLSNNSLRPEGGVALAKGLAQSTCLQQLNLARNVLTGLWPSPYNHPKMFANTPPDSFTLEAIEALAEGIAACATLTRVNVAYNAIRGIESNPNDMANPTGGGFYGRGPESPTEAGIEALERALEGRAGVFLVVSAMRDHAFVESSRAGITRQVHADVADEWDELVDWGVATKVWSSRPQDGERMDGKVW